VSRAVPRLIRSPSEIRAWAREVRGRGESVGFVPTMGALHPGHLALVEVARARADRVVVSVFVNPTQFGPNEDFDRYPRDLDADLAACASASADVVYTPGVEAMYPPGSCTAVTVSGLTEGLCGAFRPGHFTGVATVVAKLLNQVGPCRAVFGRKDYQQLKVVERLVRDLDLDVEVIGMPTVREADGLALSSRNRYLDSAARGRALALVEGLGAAWRLFDERMGRVPAGELRRVAQAPLAERLDRIDYVEVCNPDTLEPIDADRMPDGRALVAMAGWFGRTRLIDNCVLGEDLNPFPGNVDPSRVEV
jgi:pantoate--beta-alanine ligase